jgi:hypothetical protein
MLGLAKRLSGNFATVGSVAHERYTYSYLTISHSENDRGTIYIHETTPYANRDDVELNPRECKTHNSPGDKHKSFQICNRKLFS